jgi:uncharacterized small protein (DUF1192 family)
MNDRETARDLSKRLEKAQEEIARLKRILALRPDDIATSTPAIAIHLNSENNSLREEIARLRAALEDYAECGDGCTCGDGWDHKTAQEALKETL